MYKEIYVHKQLKQSTSDLECLTLISSRAILSLAPSTLSIFYKQRPILATG